MPTDPELLQAIDLAKQAHEEELMPLDEALRLMGDDRVIKESAVSAIARATPLELVDALVANPGEHLISAMRNTLELGDRQERPTWSIAQRNMQRAARDLAGRSSINQDRMKNWFNIEPEVDA